MEIKTLCRIKAVNRTFAILEPVFRAVAKKTTVLEKENDEWNVVHTGEDGFGGYYIVSIDETEREKLKKYEFVILTLRV